MYFQSNGKLSIVINVTLQKREEDPMIKVTNYFYTIIESTIHGVMAKVSRTYHLTDFNLATLTFDP